MRGEAREPVAVTERAHERAHESPSTKPRQPIAEGKTSNLKPLKFNH